MRHVIVAIMFAAIFAGGIFLLDADIVSPEVVRRFLIVAFIVSVICWVKMLWSRIRKTR